MHLILKHLLALHLDCSSKNNLSSRRTLRASKCAQFGINFAVIWCKCISNAVVFKYADVEQIKHEWIEHESGGEMEECAKTEEQSCMSHNTSRLLEKLLFEWERKKSRGKKLEYKQPKSSVFELRWQYFTSVTVQFILLKLFFRKKQKKNVFIDLAERLLKLCEIVYLSFHLQLWKARRLFSKKNKTKHNVGGTWVAADAVISRMTESGQNWPHSLQNGNWLPSGH